MPTSNWQYVWFAIFIIGSLGGWMFIIHLLVRLNRSYGDNYVERFMTKVWEREQDLQRRILELKNHVSFLQDEQIVAQDVKKEEKAS